MKSNNLTEELSALEKEQAELEKKMSSISDRKKSIVEELECQKGDPMEDKWFIYENGGQKCVFYSKKSPDKKTMYDNRMILEGKDKRAWKPIIFEGYAFTTQYWYDKEHRWIFLPDADTEQVVYAQNYPYNPIPETPNRIVVYVYTGWKGIEFITKKEAEKKYAEYIKDALSKRDYDMESYSKDGWNVSIDLKVNIKNEETD